MQEDFFSAYLEYASGNEVPVFFHRWCAIVGLGAYLGRDFIMPFGTSHIHTGMYTMLIGDPGTKKSTAINIFKDLLYRLDYKHIAADRTSKEKFLLDLAGDNSSAENNSKEEDLDSILDRNLFGESADSTSYKEMFIMADEWNDFAGLGNMEFLSLLGSLWNRSGPYENKIKNGKSVKIQNPTVSILAGNTPTNFSLAFPAEVIGQGFLTRLILVYSDDLKKKIFKPRIPDAGEINEILNFLVKIKGGVNDGTGNPILVEYTRQAEKLAEAIYNSWQDIPDVRFKNYSSRRLIHFTKMCLIFAAARLATTINEDDVIKANTILTHTEFLMPKALGEFGKSRHSDTANKIMQVLDTASDIMSVQDLYKAVQTDVDRLQDVVEILKALTIAEKIQVLPGGFLPKRKMAEAAVSNKGESSKYVDYSYLTEEERGMSK